MNRMLPRSFFAIALIAVLLAAAPAVQARPLAKPARSVPSVQTAAGDLLSAAWSWLSRLFTVEPVAAKSGSGSTTTTTGGGGLGGLKPMSGSCIDPNGCTLGAGGL
jgi:hypothetical protein